jgi:hypothetical protein
MAPHSAVGVFGTGEETRVRAAYGANYDRLVELKRTWGPENLFRMNSNIPPEC